MIGETERDDRHITSAPSPSPIYCCSTLRGGFTAIVLGYAHSVDPLGGPWAHLSNRAHSVNPQGGPWANLSERVHSVDPLGGPWTAREHEGEPNLKSGMQRPLRWKVRSIRRLLPLHPGASLQWPRPQRSQGDPLELFRACQLQVLWTHEPPAESSGPLISGIALVWTRRAGRGSADSVGRSKLGSTVHGRPLRGKGRRVRCLGRLPHAASLQWTRPQLSQDDPWTLIHAALRGFRIGEASNPGPYTEGGSSSSGSGVKWVRVGEQRWKRNDSRDRACPSVAEGIRVNEAQEDKGGPPSGAVERQEVHIKEEKCPTEAWWKVHEEQQVRPEDRHSETLRPPG